MLPESRFRDMVARLPLYHRRGAPVKLFPCYATPVACRYSACALTFVDARTKPVSSAVTLHQTAARCLGSVLSGIVCSRLELLFCFLGSTDNQHGQL